MATKRVLISMDERLLERVDSAAKIAGTTRSGYFAQLVDAELSGAIGPGADPHVQAALRAIDIVLPEKGTT
jgi:hypothetical protein